MRVALVVAGVLVIAAGAVWSEEQWPLRLEQVWETPEKGEPVFADGFPPSEIKTAFEDGDIPDEDKEWVLNNIRVWAAHKTKKLWLDDGSAMDLPVVQPGDRLRTFTIFPSRNKKYWLVRAMRIEGPEIPPKPPNPTSREEARDPEYWEKMNAWHTAQRVQKAHWREAFMGVDGRMYWEKEFGPYDTYLEDSWLGNVAAYVSNDGEMVLKTTRTKAWFCDKSGDCVEKKGFWGERAALSADGSTFVVHTGTSRSHRVDMGGKCGLAAYGRSGETKWTTEVVPGGTGGNSRVVAVSEDGARSAFVAVASRGVGESNEIETDTYVVDSKGGVLSRGVVRGESRGSVCFSKDGGSVLTFYAHLVQARDAGTGEVTWEYRTGSSVANVSASKGSVGAGIVAVSTQREGLAILSFSGQALYRGQRGKAEVFLSPNGAFLLEKAGGLKFSRLVIED